jgi:hypothetical protein
MMPYRRVSGQLRAPRSVCPLSCLPNKLDSKDPMRSGTARPVGPAFGQLTLPVGADLAAARPLPTAELRPDFVIARSVRVHEVGFPVLSPTHHAQMSARRSIQISIRRLIPNKASVSHGFSRECENAAKICIPFSPDALMPETGTSTDHGHATNDFNKRDTSSDWTAA